MIEHLRFNNSPFEKNIGIHKVTSVGFNLTIFERTSI